MNIKIEKLKNSEIEIIGSIPFENLEKKKEIATKNLGKNIKIDGFREGKIPENIILEKIGEMPILNEMAELALQEIYPSIIIDNKIDAISSPQVAITKIAQGSPMEFKIKLIVMPEFNLPDYKKIAKEKNGEKIEAVSVTDEEIKKTIEQILKNQEQPHSCSDDECKHDEQKKETPKELTDEMVKKLGDFKNVKDFKKKLKENIKTEKEQKSKEKRRLEILEGIAKMTEVEIPELLVETELRKMLAEMNDNITRMGLEFDKYLEHIKKTEEDLKKEWKSDAKNRVKIQLILNKISKEEEIKLEEEEIKQNIDAIMNQHPDAKKENVEIYVRMMLNNEKVIKLLETQK